MTSTLDIRPLRASDEDGLGTFLERNDHADVTRWFRPFAMNRESARRLVADLELERFCVALDGPDIIGLGMLRGWKEGYEVPSLGVVVDRRATARGVGRALCDWLLAEAARAGAPSVRLSVDRDNHVARALYLSLGFEPAQDDPDADPIIMTRRTRP